MTLSSFLTDKAPTSSVLLTLVTATTLPAWEKKQSEAVRKWFKANKFFGKAGTFAMIPDKDGSISRVVVGVSEPLSMWDIAALPGVLTEGTYILEGAKNADEESKLALGWLLGCYRFALHKKNEPPKATLCLSKKVDTKRIANLADAIAQTRMMISTPAEDMGPAELAAAVHTVANKHKAKVTEIIGDDLLKKGFRAIHAVGRASPRAPRLISLTWGKAKDPMLTLVGKGVCFDTGGLNLKPGSAMYLMRKDMGGAAVALGVADLVMQAKLPVRLRLLIPAVENAIDGTAFRPSDVIKMKNGLTVEVGNTDAEGRLVLADALAEAASEKPDLLIDFATLGPARGIFGTEMAAFFTNDEAIARDLGRISTESEDYLWRMPIHKPYAKMLETPFADLNSSPSSASGGAMIAASFLEKFCEGADRRIHFDFIGWNMSGKPGRPEGGEAMTLRATFALLEKLFATR